MKYIRKMIVVISVVLIAMNVLTNISADKVDEHIVGFGSRPKSHYRIDDKTSTINVEANIVFLKDAVIRIGTFNTPGNVLHIQEVGLNRSWDSKVKLWNGSIVSNFGSIINGKLVGDYAVSKDIIYRLEIKLKVPKNITVGNYSVRYLIVAHLNDNVSGSGSGGLYDDSIDWSFNIEVVRRIQGVKRVPNKDDNTGLYIAGASIISLGISGIYYRYRLVRTRKIV